MLGGPGRQVVSRASEQKGSHGWKRRGMGTRVRQAGRRVAQPIRPALQTPSKDDV